MKLGILTSDVRISKHCNLYMTSLPLGKSCFPTPVSLCPEGTPSATRGAKIFSPSPFGAPVPVGKRGKEKGSPSFLPPQGKKIALRGKQNSTPLISRHVRRKNLSPTENLFGAPSLREKKNLTTLTNIITIQFMYYPLNKSYLIYVLNLISLIKTILKLKYPKHQFKFVCVEADHKFVEAKILNDYIAL